MAILAGFIPLDYLLDMVSIGTLVAFIVVSIGVIILRVREPDLPRGIQGAAVPRHADPLGARVPLDSVRPALVHLVVVRRLGRRGTGLLPVLEPAPQRAQRRWRDGFIPTAVPGDDDVMFVEEPKDHHFVTTHKDEP